MTPLDYVPLNDHTCYDCVNKMDCLKNGFKVFAFADRCKYFVRAVNSGDYVGTLFPELYD